MVAARNGTMRLKICIMNYAQIRQPEIAWRDETLRKISCICRMCLYDEWPRDVKDGRSVIYRLSPYFVSCVSMHHPEGPVTKACKRATSPELVADHSLWSVHHAVAP